MKINELALTESVHDVQEHDWQTLLSLLSDRVKQILRLEPDREFAFGTVNSLLTKIVKELSRSSDKWRSKQPQIVRLLMPYVLKEMDYDFGTQALTIGLDLSFVRTVIRDYQEYVPAVKRILEKHRATIVKKLTQFAEENPGMLAIDLGTLKKLGLDWPELKPDIYAAYETYLLDKFDKQYNIKTLYTMLIGMTGSGQKIDEFPRLKKLIENFKYQLLFFNNIHISNTIFAQVDSYLVNVKRFKLLGVDWPELSNPDAYVRSVFNDQKENTVRQILNNIKMSADEYSLKDIAALRSIGIDWPELDIMERSLNREAGNTQQINEAQQSPFDATLVDQISKLLPKLLRTRFEYLNNRFYFGPFIDFMFDVVKTKFSEAKKQQVFELLEPVVLESIDSYISSMKDPTFAFRHFMDYFDKLLKLAQYTDYDYSAVIDRNKASILKMVLASVRVYMNEPDNIGHWSRYQSYIELARLINSWGLTWPELNKIVSSLASDRYIKTLDRTHMTQSAVPELVANMKRDHLTLKDLTPSAQEKIKAAKDRFVNRPYFSFRWRDDVKFELDSTLLAFYQDLKQLGFTWPEVDQYLAASTTRERAETQKRQIVSSMLLALKNGEWDGVPGAVKSLRDMGIDWPELDTITRSITSLSNKQIDESTSTWYYVNLILNRLKHKHFNDLPYLLSNLKSDDCESLSTHISEFDKNKSKILPILLKAIKDPEEAGIDAESDDDLIAIFANLRSIGISWPELDIIKRSIKFDQINENTTWDAVMRHHMSNISAHLSNGEPVLALRYMGERDLTVDDLDSDIRADLEAQKATAIKWLLTLFEHDIHRFGRFIWYINKTGLDWPELAVLNRSFDLEYDRLRDEFDRHNRY